MVLLLQVIVITVVCTGLKCSRHLMYVVPVNAGSWLGASSWILVRITKIMSLWSFHVALTSNNKVTVSFWGVGAMLGLHCSAWTFSSCGERGLLSNCSAWTSHSGGFSCCKAQALGTWAPVVVAGRLSNCGSRAQGLPKRRLSNCGSRVQELPERRLSNCGPRT